MLWQGKTKERKKEKKIMNKYTIKYEFLNALYNGYSFFFGAIFPIFLLHIIIYGLTDEVPAEYFGEVVTGLFIGMAVLVPLAAVFLNHVGTYANELEKNVPQRLKLFGFSDTNILLNKLVANGIFLFFCVAIYMVGTLPFLPIKLPRVHVILVWLVLIYLLGGELFLLAHGITSLVRRFAPAYLVSMTLYFLMMFLGGYMGLRQEKLPGLLRSVSDILPTTQMGNKFVDFWLGHDYNFASLVYSFLFFGALGALLNVVAHKTHARHS